MRISGVCGLWAPGMPVQGDYIGSRCALEKKEDADEGIRTVLSAGRAGSYLVCGVCRLAVPGRHLLQPDAWDGIAPTFQFVGLDNFRTLFQDFYVTRPMIQTFIYSFLITVFQNVLSLIMALALNQKLRTKGLLRTLWFIPVVIAPLIVGYIWSFLFTNPIAQMGKALGIEEMANNLLGSRHTALYAGVFVSMWRSAGYTMVIYIAAFQNIPLEIYEAAHVDGARGWRRFWNVTFPLIAPAFTINMVLTMERGFKEFDMMFTLTNGGPGNSSELISLTIYRETFEHFRAGYGSAMGVVAVRDHRGFVACGTVFSPEKGRGHCLLKPTSDGVAWRASIG
jgi:raffinose/stachyose/melibiose transport system permease protein